MTASETFGPTDPPRPFREVFRSRVRIVAWQSMVLAESARSTVQILGLSDRGHEPPSAPGLSPGAALSPSKGEGPRARLSRRPLRQAQGERNSSKRTDGVTDHSFWRQRWPAGTPKTFHHQPARGPCKNEGLNHERRGIEETKIAGGRSWQEGQIAGPSKWQARPPGIAFGRLDSGGTRSAAARPDQEWRRTVRCGWVGPGTPGRSEPAVGVTRSTGRFGAVRMARDFDLRLDSRWE